MKKTQRIKFLMTLSLMAVLVLTPFFFGCSNGEEGESEVGGVKDISLVYWSMWEETETEGQIIKEAIDDFMIENEDVSVIINWKGKDIRNTLTHALDKGEQIDIWDESLEIVITSWSDYAMPLDEYMEYGYPTTNGAPFKKAIMPSLMTLSQSFSKENELKGTWAIPYQPFIVAFIYNKDIFEKAGIVEIPETWNEFMVACEKIKEIGKIPVTSDDAYLDNLPKYYLARAKGADWVKEIVNDSGKELWNDPVVLEMATAYYDMYQKGYISAKLEKNKWPEGQYEMADGSVAMYLSGTWLPNEIMESNGEDFQWGIFSFPTIVNGVSGVEAANYGGQAFQINKECIAPDVAFALIAHLTTGEWDKKLAAKGYGIPTSIDGVWPKQFEEAKKIFAGLTDFYPWGGGRHSSNDLPSTIASNFTKLISGKITPIEFASEMQM